MIVKWHSLSILFLLAVVSVRLFAQTDTLLPSKSDTITSVISPIPPSSSAEDGSVKSHSFIAMEFVKEKSFHATDSVFFNVLKITNNSSKPVGGIVQISAPEEWKIISMEETNVSIPPGNTEYVPMRISLSRSARGGVTYLINATLSSDKSLFENKNQTALSKSCYVTIPKKQNWDMQPVTRTVYFNRYSEYSNMEILFTNKGNGNEMVKIELEMGSSLFMYGSLGRKYLTSVELKPNSDTVLSFPFKYLPVDESVVYNRDFRSLTVRVNATVDSTIKRTSVNFKYLESVYTNQIAAQSYPLNIDVELQNLLSQSDPRLVFGSDGSIIFKNNHTLDYFVRFSGIQLKSYDYDDIGNVAERALWKQSRMRVIYDAHKWKAMVGDIGFQGITMLGIGGRGIGGNYEFNKKNKISASFMSGISRTTYSGNIMHETLLPYRIRLSSEASFLINEYNKMNTFGGGIRASMPVPHLKGHSMSLLVAGSRTIHFYNNQTFTDPNGNYIITNDPGKSFNGIHSNIIYNIKRSRLSTSINARYLSNHFSQYNNGRIVVQGVTTFIVNNQYAVHTRLNYNRHTPFLYNRGVLYPQNNVTYGRYEWEIANKLNRQVALSWGILTDHSDYRRLKIIRPTNDSVYTRFTVFSPKASVRTNIKSGPFSSFSAYLLTGYAYITHIEDSSLNPTLFPSTKPNLNTNVGVNMIQKNWGINVSYYTGPYNIAMQSDYYYSGFANKTLRIMPYFNRYFYNKKLLVSSYNSYFYQTKNNMESINLNARLSFFLEKGWTLYLDKGIFMNSRVNYEGQRVFSKMVAINVGFRKSFDIPQPGVKYYDLKIVCFKDVNGNGFMDNNEHGLPDIVITIDRNLSADSVIGKPVQQKGQFSPTELVSDNFGQVQYFRIPGGEYSLNVFSLTNLKELFNVKGQKQTLNISSDTTYYIPFTQSFRVSGRIILNRDEFSSLGNVSVANIRVTATDSSGNNFMALTGRDGSYVIYVPHAGNYRIIASDVFDGKFVPQETEYIVSFNGAKEFQVNFIFNEKKRKINVKNGDETGKILPLFFAGNDTIRNVQVVMDTIISPKTPSIIDNVTQVAGQPQKYFYSLPVGQGITYSIQLISGRNRIPSAQLKNRFPGIQNVREYSENDTYKYVVGDVKTVEDARKLKEELRSKGYKDAFIVPFYKGVRVRYK